MNDLLRLTIIERIFSLVKFTSINIYCFRLLSYSFSQPTSKPRHPLFSIFYILYYNSLLHSLYFSSLARFFFLLWSHFSLSVCGCRLKYIAGEVKLESFSFSRKNHHHIVSLTFLRSAKMNHVKKSFIAILCMCVVVENLSLKNSFSVNKKLTAFLNLNLFSRDFIFLILRKSQNNPLKHKSFHVWCFFDDIYVSSMRYTLIKRFYSLLYGVSTKTLKIIGKWSIGIRFTVAENEKNIYTHTHDEELNLDDISLYFYSCSTTDMFLLFTFFCL